MLFTNLAVCPLVARGAVAAVVRRAEICARAVVLTRRRVARVAPWTNTISQRPSETPRHAVDTSNINDAINAKARLE